MLALTRDERKIAQVLAEEGRRVSDERVAFRSGLPVRTAARLRRRLRLKLLAGKVLGRR